NSPYNITSRILEKFLSARPQPSLLVLLVQKEVAERLTAKPGQMSLLSAIVQYYGEPRLLKKVPASAFWPRPQVDSAILKIIPRPGICPVEEKATLKLMRAGFSRRRRMLAKNLRGLFSQPEIEKAFARAALGLKIRAEELDRATWLKLAHCFLKDADKDRDAV
ncbi:MAG: 16S rRNA (adenine(1518)-N(6)/adenine(1519)-N(6))-dimethyltransferase, partial [Candidatus Magasanikbacteria bacterium]|nr:16S rRNA (adenine(1518)-N(6)/adenine(1519)-N(6))-dimethyltransferase [Candidatus Magasanikbacteria bacterium]